MANLEEIRTFRLKNGQLPDEIGPPTGRQNVGARHRRP